MKHKVALTKLKGNTDLEDLNNVLTILQGTNGVEVVSLKDEINTFNLIYENTNLISQVKYDSNKQYIYISFERSDFLTIELIRYVIENASEQYYLYFPDLDTNLVLNIRYTFCYQMQAEDINSIRKTIENTDFELFYYERGPYSTNWYAINKEDGTVHFLNDNLIHYFENKREVEMTKELSYKVAEDVKDFVRRANVEMLPDHFYMYYGKNTKIINYSGININNPKRKIFVKPYILEIDDINNEFYKIANQDSALLYMDKIRQGETLDQTLLRIIKDELKIADDYLGATVSRALEYDYDKNDNLIPRLIVHMYIEKANLTEEQKKKKKRSWISMEQVQDYQNLK